MSSDNITNNNTTQGNNPDSCAKCINAIKKILHDKDFDNILNVNMALSYNKNNEGITRLSVIRYSYGAPGLQVSPLMYSNFPHIMGEYNVPNVCNGISPKRLANALQEDDAYMNTQLSSLTTKKYILPGFWEISLYKTHYPKIIRLCRSSLLGFQTKHKE